MTKRIKDIRYYASDTPNIDGHSLPSDCAAFFDFSKDLHAWGARIAQSLRAIDFSLGDFDHLYINFTDVLPVRALVCSDRKPERWLRYVDVGVDFEEVRGYGATEREAFVIRSTFACLRKCCGEDPTQVARLEEVERQVDAQGSALLIPVKTKQTKSYTVAVGYKLRLSGDVSHGVVTYTKHKTGALLSKRFVDLDLPSDIFALVGSIAVKSGAIVIKPRASFRASLHASHYEVPLEIEINEMH